MWEFIRVGTTLYKIVNQPRINGGFVKKRIVWNNETLRQDMARISLPLSRSTMVSVLFLIMSTTSL